MTLRRALLATAALAAAALACGCGGGADDDGTSLAATAPSGTATVPRAADDALGEECTRLSQASRVPVLCPEQLPAASGDDRSVAERFRVGGGDLAASDCAYLIELHARQVDRGAREPFHVLAGGRCRPFPLTGQDGRWPPRSQTADAALRLVGRAPLTPGEGEGEGERMDPVRPRVVGRVRVGDAPGLLLRVEPFPSGGIHGGHHAVVWNRDGHGYVLSFHFRSRDERNRGERATTRSLLDTAATLSAASAVPRDGAPVA